MDTNNTSAQEEDKQNIQTTDTSGGEQNDVVIAPSNSETPVDTVVDNAEPNTSPQPVQPVANPANVNTAYQANQPTTNIDSSSENKAMILFLQWLTYALWGWLLLPMIWIVFAITFSAFGGATVEEWIFYPMAAVMVLLPAAIVTDFFYSKKEPVVKKGASLVIMLIHAVIFVLFGIGFIIGAVFSIVNIILNSGSDAADSAYIVSTSTSDTSGATASLISCLIVALLYAIVSVRTIKPALLRPGWGKNEK